MGHMMKRAWVLDTSTDPATVVADVDGVDSDEVEAQYEDEKFVVVVEHGRKKADA